MKKKKIGIPQAMYYFEFGNVWKNFFEALGLETVLSGETNAANLESGVKYASSDLCLPVKAMFGHVQTLLSMKEKPDYIFLPNIYITFGKCYTCPKTIGLTDMLKATFHPLPAVISPSFYGDMAEFLICAGTLLGFSRLQSTKAYLKAKPEKKRSADVKMNVPTVALAGHSYLLNDNFLNMEIKNKLRAMNVNCITPDVAARSLLSKLANTSDYKKPFWHSANRNLGFTRYVVDNQKADGIIFLNSFGCGTDSLSLGFCRDYIRRHSTIPSITVSLDEHSGEAGIVTRLEAFVDCLNVL